MTRKYYNYCCALVMKSQSCALFGIYLYIYIYIYNITEGFLFPDLTDRTKVRKYGNFLKTLKQKFSDILSRDAPMTTHCFRKTGYLFAVWGGGVFNVIAHSARHDDEGVAMVYFKDAEAIKLLADDRPNPLNKVPQWKQIRIVQGQNAELVRGDQETDVTLLEIASRFMRYMKLHNLPPGSNTIEQITSAAYRFGKDRLPVAGLMQEFNSVVLNLRLSERRSKKVKRSFEALIEGAY